MSGYNSTAESSVCHDSLKTGVGVNCCSETTICQRTRLVTLPCSMAVSRHTGELALRYRLHYPGPMGSEVICRQHAWVGPRTKIAHLCGSLLVSVKYFIVAARQLPHPHARSSTISRIIRGLVLQNLHICRYMPEALKPKLRGSLTLQCQAELD